MNDGADDALIFTTVTHRHVILSCCFNTIGWKHNRDIKTVLTATTVSGHDPIILDLRSNWTPAWRFTISERLKEAVLTPCHRPTHRALPAFENVSAKVLPCAEWDS